MLRHLSRASTQHAPLAMDEDPPFVVEKNGIVKSHEEYIVQFMTDTRMFKQALLSLREASMRIAKRFTDYSAIFMDKSDPEIDASARCCERTTAFFESFAQSLAACGSSVENVAVENFKRCMDEISNARECGKRYSAAYNAAEIAKKRMDTINKKSSGVSHPHQKEIEQTRKACELVERDAKYLYGLAIHDSNIVTMRSFVSFFDMLETMFNSCYSLSGDFKNYRDEFQVFCSDNMSRDNQSAGSAEPFSDTDTDTDADADADESFEGALVGNAQDCFKALTDDCAKYASYMTAYQDILSKMQVDLTGSKISPNDIAKLAKATQEIEIEFAAIEDKLKSAPSNDSNLIPVIIEVVSSFKQKLEDPYKHYFESSPHVKYLFEKHQKNKVIRAGQKQYEQRCVRSGLTQEKWIDSVLLPARFPDALLSEVRSLFNRLPGENPAWEPLKNATDHLSDFTDFAKEAKKRSNNMSDLLALRERLPGEKNLVSISRVFHAEGKLTFVSISNSSPDLPPPLPGHSPALPGPLQPLHNVSSSLSSAATTTLAATAEEGSGLVVGHTYAAFLFSDMLLFCVPKKKGNLEKGYVVVKRFFTRSLSFKEDEDCDHGFQLTHSGSTMHFTVGDEYQLWIDKLNDAVTERNKNVVFGVALNKLMERCPEKLVPAVFSDAADYIKENAKDAEGIFRLSVTSNVLLEVQEMIDSGKSVLYTDVYVAANIIKSWLRALPEPLMTFAMFDDWISAQDDPKRLHDLVQKLPKENSFLLSALIRLMKDIAVYADVTRMTSNNLAIVIAPNILYRRGDEMNISQGPTNVVDTLVLSYDEVFKDVIKEESLKAKHVNEIARCRRNTLRKLKCQNTGANFPTTLGVNEPKKSHHQTSTQASLMSMFNRDSSSSGDSIPPPPIEIPPSTVPPPKVTVPKITATSPSSLSSSVLSETVNELMSLQISSDSNPLPAEFDVSDISLSSGTPPGTPMANPDILPPPLVLPDIQPPPPVGPPPVNDIPPPDIPPPPL